MKIFLIAFLILTAGVAIAAATTTPAKLVKHPPAAGVGCIDCHLVDEPKTLAGGDSCIGCHGDMMDGKVVKFKDHKGVVHEANVHDSHESPIDCTKCHGIHKPSTLFCNTCHTFDLKVL